MNHSAPKSQTCHHCGLACPDDPPRSEQHHFCCVGCLAAFQILESSGLAEFYELRAEEIEAQLKPAGTGEFAYLDSPEIRRRLVDFHNDRSTRVTFRIEAIHCVACVWLLENLPRLNPAVRSARVQFSQRELSVHFATAELKLSELVSLLAAIGYERS